MATQKLILNGCACRYAAHFPQIEGSTRTVCQGFQWYILQLLTFNLSLPQN